MIRAHHPVRRAGFTLIELMVSISIVAILASLSIAAVLRFMTVQAESNTRTTIQKTYTGFDSQWKAAVDTAKDEFHDSRAQSGATYLAGGDRGRAMVIWTLARLRQEFPQNYTEARTATTSNYGINLPPKPVYLLALGNRTGGNPQAESAACLYLALSQSRRGTTFSPEEALGASAIRDSDNDGLKEICDGFDQPLVLWRFPFLNEEYPQNNPDPNFKPAPGVLKPNPLDPEGRLAAPGWNNFDNAALVTEVERLTGLMLHKGSSQQDWQPWVCYAPPAIGSGGKDKILGVDFGTMQTVNKTGSFDNLYSFRLNLGASGN